MPFSTLQELNQFVSVKLQSELHGRTVSFLPIPNIPTADCGSAIFLELAQLHNIDPQGLGERLLPLLDSNQFNVSHGFLNFSGNNDLSWLLTTEPRIKKPASFQNLRIGVMSDSFDAMGKSSMQSIRIRSMALFQIYLLLFVDNNNPISHYEIELLVREGSVIVTKENFFDRAKEFLLQDNVSINPDHISDEKPIFLHISPKGLTKKLYQFFIESERSERYWLKFLSLERVFYNAPTLPWSSSFIDRLFQDDKQVLSSLFYLSSSLQATELDDTVPFNCENANLYWWIEKVLTKCKHQQIYSLPQANNIELTDENRVLILMLKFFNQYIFEAKYHGKFFDLSKMLTALLAYSERSINHPTHRAALERREVRSDIAYILAGVSKRLELFSV